VDTPAVPPEFLLAAPLLDLPTERDIVRGMDIIRLQFTGSQPQANLVPQQQNRLAPVGTYLPSGADEGRAQGGAPQAQGADKWDPAHLLISPLQNSLIGLGPLPEPVPPPLAGAGMAPAAVAVDCPEATPDAERTRPHMPTDLTWSPGRWWEVGSAVALAIAVASAALAADASRWRKSPWV
jgi:hypothetical protein